MLQKHDRSEEEIVIDKSGMCVIVFFIHLCFLHTCKLR